MAEAEAERTIPESERPNLSGADTLSGDEPEFGEPETPDVPDPVSGSQKETYVDSEGVERYVGSNRKKRSDSGGSRTSGKRRKAKAPDPGSAGGTVLYGGIGMMLSVSGLAPAAGMSMQGLADEAGPEISDWAKKRSPRFYQFLCTLSEAGGIGKFIAAPVTAEAYLRMEAARPALGPAVVSLHGADSVEAFDKLTESYDQWKAESAAREAAARNGRPEGPELPPEWGGGEGAPE
jgi:hypothetical protein